MKLLLDTHILLWFQAGDPALPKAAEQAIRSEANEAYVSMVSFWEIGLKHSIGKLPLRMPHRTAGSLPPSPQRHSRSSLWIARTLLLPQRCRSITAIRSIECLLHKPCTKACN
jgi:PIN domain nuclease of toxin-antitoxin system